MGPRRRIVTLALGWCAVMLGCTKNKDTILEAAPSQILAELKDRAVDVSLGDGAVRYLGFRASPNPAYPGDLVRLTHYWVAERAIKEDYRVFVHGLVQGARGWIPNGDHDPTPDTDKWPVGKVIRDQHEILLPKTVPGTAIDLRVGLFRGQHRMPVDDPTKHDGGQRILAGRFSVQGQQVPLPTYQAKFAKTPPTIDGKLDDEVWKEADIIDGLNLSSGSGPSQVETRIRVAWDEQHIYVGFEAQDEDIQGTYTQRDQPIYRQEVLEMFIDADADGADYVELQVSPLQTQFDARFEGGARRNMDVDYNATWNAAVDVDGTVQASDNRDKGWRAEWAIDVSSLPDAPKQLKDGLTFKVNFFRIAKDGHGAATHHDESAWSPPLMGDFHNLERFGELHFVRSEDNVAN